MMYRHFVLKHSDQDVFRGGYLHNMHQHKCPRSQLLLPHIFLHKLVKETCKKSRKLHAFFLGPKAHVHDPVQVLLVGSNHMHDPMQKFLICFGPIKLYAFPICISSLQMLCIFEYIAGVPLVPNNNS